MKKLTVEKCEQVSISTLLREQKYHLFKLKPVWNTEHFYSILAQRLKNISTYSLMRSIHLRLKFTSTVPHFGGLRYWFICPQCGQRAGKLYKPKFEGEFRCRHCHNLTYTSSQTHNQRVNALSKKLDEIYSKEGDEALGQTIWKMQLTRRGIRLLNKACSKHKNSFPPTSWVRSDKEKEAYDKYVRPLLED